MGWSNIGIWVSPLTATRKMGIINRVLMNLVRRPLPTFHHLTLAIDRYSLA